MTPISAPAGAAITWHDAQIDELFASLLGRGFEHAHGGAQLPANGDGGLANGDGDRMDLDVNLNDALKGGFRVFG